jgi:hypothetical protein
MTSQINLSKLHAMIESGELPEYQADRFADVSIVAQQPEAQPMGFYPEDCQNSMQKVRLKIKGLIQIS